jgi:REP element-mobilizing transposase RayT
MSRRQLKFFRRDKIFFGGGLRCTHPTKARPFSKKCDIHVVIKSSYAKGELSFLKAYNRKEIQVIIEKYAKRFYITLKRSVNVGNHIHLLIHAQTAEMLRRFLRAITAMIARHVTRSKKGNPSNYESFWDARPFTRLVNWGKAYETILHYLSLNSLEAIGFTKVMAREYLKTFSTV